ncbi:hypothetical protein H310_09754 [Aphanomyces invadans]|uniref:Peptidase M14 domain-containing protein n=1 Tax=Aphanomyces invadans TaxID=157072 RepID=A0A024TTX6_9STRA|nr:hypothetical protein H310_09754 [Aphanomyces invadans]ETV97424.1 hypothetical protein H310_09754 [Aphanomyces invadans]RHY30717.1 hypothetical protein DYB32_004075 [Aphanomyces invadans]|eukprot:XP_008874132.1 hypothetical protein H310_09754 [Aphanomyces invadans]
MNSSLLAFIALLAATAAAPFTLTNEDINDGKIRTPEQLQAIQDDGDDNRKCHDAYSGYLPGLKPGNYRASTFHKCFRTSTQINEYLDALVKQNPSVITKFQISETVRKQPIWGYKIIGKAGAKAKSLYFESLIHAREWTTGASTVYTISRILDDLSNGKNYALDLYNLCFVPIVNVDGYDISWTAGKRYQRKNANDVDLNRNFVSFYANPNPPKPGDQTYPGPFPFSEPETKGIDAWIKTHSDEFAGYVDIHANARSVLVPYGDTHQPIGGGEDEKFAILGEKVKDALNNVTNNPKEYIWEKSGQLYLAYGCFDDYFYRTYKQPTMTLEMTGADFVVPYTAIPTRGDEIYYGMWQFAKSVAEFNGTAPTAVPTTVVSTTVVSTTTKPAC